MIGKRRRTETDLWTERIKIDEKKKHKVSEDESDTCNENLREETGKVQK